jgi:S4 domain protein YaaA
MNRSITVSTEYITLGQALKLADVVQSGGQAKFFIAEHEILVNGSKETRRGRKLYPGDHLTIEGLGSFQIRSERDADRRT